MLSQRIQNLNQQPSQKLNIILISAATMMMMSCGGNNGGGGSSAPTPPPVGQVQPYGQPYLQGYPGNNEPYCTEPGFVPTNYGCEPVCPRNPLLASFNGGFCNVPAVYAY